MSNEYEVIQHTQISHLNSFVVTIDYRTPHLHRDFEAALVLDGKIQLVSHNRAYQACAAELLLLNPNQPHALQAKGDGGATLLCLQASPKYFSSSAPYLENLYFDNIMPFQALCAATRRQLTDCLLELGVEYQLKRPFYELLCTSMLHMIFYLLLENVPTHQISRNERQAMEKKVERITKLLDYVDNNYTNKVRLSDIARREGVSLSYLSLFVKENLNQTFQDYVSTVRFNQARKLIITSDKRLIDVCVESGFSDPRYLTKAFVKKTGITPDEYRKIHAQEEPGVTMHHSPHSSQRYYSAQESMDILTKARAALGKRPV